MPQVHPSSVIEPGAKLAESVVVGPMCYIGGKAVIGAGTRLVSHVTILGRTTIGEGNVIWPQAVLGATPQDLKFRGEDSELIIGDRNQIREAVTIHLGTANDANVTRVGSDNLFMVGVHVAHDCVVGSRTLLANNVCLAGHVFIEDHTNVAGIVGAHHFVTFGRYCYVGGMSRVVHDVPPFMIAEGDPATVRGVNERGLRRHGFSDKAIANLREAYKRLYRRRRSPDAPPQAPFPARLDALLVDFADDENIALLVAAIRNTLLSPHGRYRETLRRDNRNRRGG